jgi:SPP1 family predicted phage head-tail adaptor
MNSERLRHRITIQSPPSGTDSYGDPVGDWTDFATIWAGIEPLQGREYVAALQEQSEVDTRVVIRYLKRVRPSMRVKYGERTLNIISVIDNREAHRDMQLMCKEVL